jgi:hypothetical protein
MSRRRGLPCSLSILAVALSALVGPARDAGAYTQPDDKSFAFEWSDVGVTDQDAPPGTPGGGGQFNRTSAFQVQPPPPAIAAPLPPALLSGLIGLATAYACKRRSRLR